MAKPKYIEGKEPHPSEMRMIFRNVDRKGWSPDIDSYIKDGGYEVAKKALKMKPADITNEVKASGLRGRGGGDVFALVVSLPSHVDGDHRCGVIDGELVIAEAAVDHDLLVYDAPEAVHAATARRTASNATRHDEVHDDLHGLPFLQSPFWFVYLLHHLQPVGRGRTKVVAAAEDRIGNWWWRRI